MDLNINRRHWLLAAGAAVWQPVGAQGASTESVEFGRSRIRFATQDEAREFLMTPDEWMHATGAFQRRSTLQSRETVTFEAFQRWNAQAARAWRPEHVRVWSQALALVAPAFNSFGIPLPQEVLLIASNGQESADSPYTRGHAVVITVPPNRSMKHNTMLLAHELWHVASRYAPALATRLYKEIGFEPVPEVAFPKQWADLRIANPDAPFHRHAMRIRVQGRSAWVTPLLVAAKTDTTKGESFLEVAETRLLEIEVKAETKVSRAVERRGEPVWHRVEDVPDYLLKLGGNTGYVIHPEETLADNVALLVNDLPVRNTGLLSRIGAVLRERRLA